MSEEYEVAGDEVAETTEETAGTETPAEAAVETPAQEIDYQGKISALESQIAELRAAQSQPEEEPWQPTPKFSAEVLEAIEDPVQRAQAEAMNEMHMELQTIKHENDLLKEAQENSGMHNKISSYFAKFPSIANDTHYRAMYDVIDAAQKGNYDPFLELYAKAHSKTVTPSPNAVTQRPRSTAAATKKYAKPPATLEEAQERVKREAMGIL